MNSPAKILSFLITPFPDLQLFDPTLAFLALGALPLAVMLYYLGNHLRAGPESHEELTKEDANKGNTSPSSEEKAPLIIQEQTPSQVKHLPVLDSSVWPNSSNGTIDVRLIIGAILFGVGWGTLGICRE